MVRSTLLILALLSVIGGLATSWFFLNELSKEYHVVGDEAIRLMESGQVGDFIGGVVGTAFSLAAFILLAFTFSEQSRSATRNSFETKFFNLLNLHRENVRELARLDDNGRKEFHNIFMQFLMCKEDLMPVFRKMKEEDVYEEKYREHLKASLTNTTSTIDLIKLAKLNLPYLILFYGVSADGKSILRDVLIGKYKEVFIDRAIEFMAMKPIEDSIYHANWKAVAKLVSKKQPKVFELIRKKRNSENIDNSGFDPDLIRIARAHYYPSSYVKFYGGHQFRLGHYFRHLFQVFTFINQQPFLSSKEKYFYAKTLRAQLSTHEQALLFVNSLSFLGLVWDLVPEIDRYRLDPLFRVRLKRRRLITRYNLIKNLPGQEIFGITYKEFYPDVDFEHERK